MGAIQLKNVTKRFGDQMVIDDLNLSTAALLFW